MPQCTNNAWAAFCVIAKAEELLESIEEYTEFPGRDEALAAVQRCLEATREAQAWCAYGELVMSGYWRKYQEQGFANAQGRYHGD